MLVALIKIKEVSDSQCPILIGNMEAELTKIMFADDVKTQVIILILSYAHCEKTQFHEECFDFTAELISFKDFLQVIAVLVYEEVQAMSSLVLDYFKEGYSSPIKNDGRAH